MHIVPGFTVFHQSHAELAGRFHQMENYTHRDVFEAAPEDSKPGSLLNMLMGGSNEELKVEKVLAEQDQRVVKSEKDASTASTHKPVASKPKSLPRCPDRRNTYFSLCLALISLAFGYLLVHGVISRQPAHLLPFFCLQVFDFVVALICMLGYMSSASDISHWLRMKIATQVRFNTC